jgi:hypothetical protein
MVGLLTAIPAAPAAAATAGQIIFVSNRWSNGSEVALRDSSSVVNISDIGDLGDAQPSVAPNGKKIAYWNDSTPRGLYVMNVDGSGKYRITNGDQNPSNYGQWTDASPTWNATSDEIAFHRYGNGVGTYHSNTQIYKVSVDGGVATRLTDNSDYDHSPDWSPDGSKIAFISSRDGVGTGIFTMNEDGTSQALLPEGTSCAGDVEYGPASSGKVYYTCVASNSHIYSANIDGDGNPVDLTAVEGPTLTQEQRPVAYGTKIAFESYRDSNWEVYEMDNDGTDAVNKSSHSAWDRDPAYVPSTFPGSTTNKEYVSLGDSVASGEGIADEWHWDPNQGDYGAWVRWNNSPQWASSIIWGEDCHRTAASYPTQIAFAKGWTLHPYACSGAEAVDGILKKQGVSPSEADLPQLGSNETGYDTPNSYYNSATPDVVTVTIGANDIEFSDWVRICYTGVAGTPCGTQDDTDQLSDAQDNQVAHLREVLREIKRRGEAPNPDKVPDVYLTKYYDPFPATYTQCPDTVPVGEVGVGITSGEMSWLRAGLSDLNANIQAVADETEFSGMTIRVVDLDDVMEGHRWCSNSPWVYGASIAATSPFNKAPFHPTPAGQEAIANRFLACINNSSNCD